MKYLSFKILIICIFLPPILYLISVNRLEIYLTHHYHQEIKNTYLSDMNDILNGSKTLRTAVNDSIHSFLTKDPIRKLGVKLNIIVTTHQGNILYPSYSQDVTPAIGSNSPITVAKNNFKLIESGLSLEVDAKIPPFSLLAVGILVFYLLIIAGGLYGYYRRVTQKIRREDLEKAAELGRLHQLEGEYAKQIDSLSSERESLMSQYHKLQTTLDEQKKSAEQNEEEMFDEIEQLEEQLKQNLKAQTEQQEQIEILQEQIQTLEKLKENIDKQREKAADRLLRRFKTLYKNIEVSERAVYGFTDLDEDMALKAEEIMHQLNDDASTVVVKRKVFSKKSRETILEVVFAYRGRLYFRRIKSNRIEVVVIGTKNSQNKDLAYINSL